MIPLKLELEGIYSYKEKQVIDFERLTQAGLFGIFGAVGSGKSSILEAVIIALYGEPERLSNKGERGSLINLQSQRLYIEFEFGIGKDNEERYMSRYELKRSKKDFNSVETAKHNFYKWNGADWEPMNVDSAESILGMKLSDFKRTIIIPQGKFREFVDLKDKDRTMMLSDLFHLDKYDLTSPVKNMLDKNHDEITKLQAIAGTIGDISDERKVALEKDIEERKDVIDTKGKEIETIGVQVAQLELKEAQFVDLKNVTDLVNSFEVRKDEMNGRRVLLEKYRTAIIHFKNDFDLIDKAKNKVSSLDSSIGENEKLKADTEVQLKEVGEKKGKLLEELSSKDEKQKRVELLQKIIEWNELRLSFDKEKTALDLLKSSLDVALGQSSVKQIELKALQDRLIVVESELPASDVFVSEVSALKDWKKTLEISSQIENEISKYNNEKVLLTNQLDILRGNWLESEYPTFDSVLDKIEKEISVISDKKEREKIKLGLSAFVAHVNEGQPCPLCGSHDHPSVLHSIGGEELMRIEAEELAMKSKQGQFNKAVLEVGKIQTALDSIEKAVLEKQNAKFDAQTVGAESAMLFEKKGHLSIDDAEGYLRSIETLFKERDSLMQSSSALRNELDQLKLKAETHRDALTQAEKQVLLVEANISRISKEVESTTEDWWMKYLSMDAASIRNDIKIVADRISSIDQRFNDANKEFETVQTELSVVTARLDTDRLDLGKSKEELVELNDRFQRNMTSSPFTKEDEILELLKSNLDDKKEQSVIDEFDRDYAVANNQKSLLEEKLGTETFDAEGLTVLRNKFIEEQDFLKQLNGQLGESRASLRILNDGVSQMKQIKSDLDSATSRKMGLKELDSLFKAKGFVSYISNFYLRELCASANVRFNKLTRNQLSLEVDDNNVFFVKDYLNEGKLRLLKTLSGGQTFQASLCLALALAERVKVLNQSDKSFFFLDEGFGSLDRDSLSVVLETLKTLRRENRIVGIISHVEELQQEMDVSLRIELDKERGSLVLIQ
jgi:exonuclease SbcC